MNISAIQAKLLLSQIGTKELTKANVAQNTKVIQKDQRTTGTESQYTENDINDKAEISQEAVNRFNKERDNVNDSMELDKKEKIQMPICTKELVELIKEHARFLNSRLLKPV